MVPAVWRLCLWTLEELADSPTNYDIRKTGLRGNLDQNNFQNSQNSNNFQNYNSFQNFQNLNISGVGDISAIYLSNKNGLARTVLTLCECMPSMREIVVSNLLGKCYINDDNSSNNNNNNSSSSSSRSNRYNKNSYDNNYNNNNTYSNNNDNNNNSDQMFEETPLGFSSRKYGIISDYNTKYLNYTNTDMSLNYAHNNDDNNGENDNYNNGEGEGGDDENCRRDERGGGIGKETGYDEKNAIKIRLLQQIKQTRLRKQSYLTSQSQSLLAATVLQHLVRAYPEIGASVLTSIMDRLTPSSPSQWGLVALPPPAILHW